MRKIKCQLCRLAVMTLVLVAFNVHAANRPPVISGTPSATAKVGASYLFQPTASDPERAKLKFRITGKPAWAAFNTATGKLSGTPAGSDVGTYKDIRISVSDGRLVSSLAPFTLSVSYVKKAAYGHYFATRYADTPADAAMLCAQPGVRGVVWRETWGEVETSPGIYDFSSFDQVLAAISGSSGCQLWVFIEYKSFNSSPVKNPCPAYLQSQYSGLNSSGSGAATCFMWEPVVVAAYQSMMRAAAARYDSNPRVEGLILQESALGFSGEYSQDIASGGTYSAEAWRDGLIAMISTCGNSFLRGRCMAFLNFLRGGQQYLYDVSAAIVGVPDNRGCYSGPDLLPNEPTLYTGAASTYEVLTRHAGCRSNSAQFASFEVPECDLSCIFKFAVSGTFGDFPETTPSTGASASTPTCSGLTGLHRPRRASTGLTRCPLLTEIRMAKAGLTNAQGVVGRRKPP